MYHCHTQFYLTGNQRDVFELIKKMPPLEHFTHRFSESGTPEESLTAGADVIFVGLQDLDAGETIKQLIRQKKEKTELIVLAEREKVASLLDCMSEITDIWMMPASKEEIEFRFLRWQQNFKMGTDFWQTSQYLESTINNIPNLIWYKDKDGVHKKVNDSFCRTVNKSKEQVQGQRHAYIWDVEEDDPVCIESENEVMRGRKTFVSEEMIQTGDGMRILTTYKSPLYDYDGSVMGTVGVANDITQERAYEREIGKKNHVLEMIFTTMDCGMICHTIDGSQIISINKAALKILGYESQEELMEHGFDTVASSVLEEDKDGLRDSIDGLEKEGDNVSVEYHVRHKNGEILHVMGNVKLVEENGMLFYQRFLLDCTTQKLQEKRRQEEAEKRQMELIHALSIDFNLVYFFDLDSGMGMSLRINEDDIPTFEFSHSRKVSMRQSLDRYIEEFVYEEDREMMREASSQEMLKKELEKKDLYYVNYRVADEGRMKYYQMKVVRTGADDGNRGIVIGFRSVDAETREEMKKKSLLEDALLQANKANKAKSVFLSNMSHDIRTPMNAIVGFTTLALAHQDKKERVEEYLNKIKSSGDHLLNLINDVLDMSRIESGKMHLEEKPCCLPEVLQDLRNILQADISAKKLQLKIETINVLDRDIYCDKLRLNQVLLNLLSNAVKYTDEGGMVTVSLVEHPGAPAGSANYEFLIRDTGIGMSKDFVKHIFEPFERERNSTISGIQGTGLGMAITNNIVNMMNGSIKVSSEQGVGTEFSVSFTFRLDPEAAEHHAATTEEKGEKKKGSSRSHSGRILLAEDIELNQEIAVTILEESGFSTEVAENGKIAVDMVRRSEPGYYQLVLMDIQMPEMNGYEATREIRRLEDKELASIPILAMSANAFEEDKQEAMKCGMNGHISKPIDVKTLLETLDSIIL